MLYVCVSVSSCRCMTVPCLHFFKAFEVGSPISISRSWFSVLSVLSTTTDSRDVPLFSLTTLIIIVRTSSDSWYLLCNRVRKGINSSSKF